MKQKIKSCDNCKSFPECKNLRGLVGGFCGDYQEQSEIVTCDMCKEKGKNLRIMQVSDARKAAQSGWWYIDKNLLCPDCVKAKAKTKGPWKMGASREETIDIIRWRAGK